MSPHVRIHQARQTLAGSVVVSAPSAPSDSLVADPFGTATIISGLSVPVLTVTSHSTTPSSTPTNTPAPSSKSSKSISTGAIVGIVVGIFVAVAAVMITLMTLKHRKQMAKRKQQMREARAAAAAKKGTGRGGDAMQMREKPAERSGSGGGGSGVDIAYPPAPPAAMRESSHDGDSSFLSLRSTHSLQRIPPITPQSNNPFLPYLPSQNLAALAESSSSPSQHSPTAAATPYAESRPSPPRTQTHAPAPSADETHAIPNPFGSPPPSRSPSQSTHAHSPSLDMDQLASFPAVQFANDGFTLHPENPTFSISEYTDDADADSIASPTKESKATMKQAKARELKAMQDLISALDTPASAQSSAPSSWIDPGAAGPGGKSRLSMGEGLVTPVEESSGSTLVANDPNSVATPLPPAELFRAALALDKGKGNPFAG